MVAAVKYLLFGASSPRALVSAMEPLATTPTGLPLASNSVSVTLILADVDTVNVAFSIEYMLKHNIPINDAIHLYAALACKSSIDEFVCSDKNLKRAAEGEGFNIFDPEE